MRLLRRRPQVPNPTSDAAIPKLHESVQRLADCQERQDRAGVVSALHEIIVADPRRLADRLRYGRFREQLGYRDEAGIEFDGCLDQLDVDGELDGQLVDQLLRNAAYGPDVGATAARLERLLGTLERVRVREAEARRIVDISRVRVLFALRRRAPFIESAHELVEHYPSNPRVRQLCVLADRWAQGSDAGEPAKVFVIGLSRTGTTSLHEALQILGYSSLHWTSTLTGALPDDVDIALHDAFGDINISARFAELAARFPDSRFILTSRELGSWTRSVSAHYERFCGVSAPRELRSPEHGGHFGGRVGEIQDVLYSRHRSGEEAYLPHQQRDEAVFADQPDRLLRMTLADGDGWPELAGFLGRAVPDVSFPHSNAGPVSAPGARRGGGR